MKIATVYLTIEGVKIEARVTAEEAKKLEQAGYKVRWDLFD